MGGERIVKKFQRKPGGGIKKNVRLRRMDDVELDLRNMGVKRWRARGLDRTEWASVVREDKAKRKVLSAKEDEEELCESGDTHYDVRSSGGHKIDINDGM
jgi:hypothetical protein